MSAPAQSLPASSAATTHLAASANTAVKPTRPPRRDGLGIIARRQPRQHEAECAEQAECANGILHVTERQRHRFVGRAKRTKQRRRRHVAAVQLHAAMPRRGEGAILLRLIDRQARRIAGYQEHAVALAVFIDRGDRQHDEHIGQRAVGDPGLLTGDAKSVAIRFGASCEQLGMRSDTRLRNCHRHDARLPCIALRRGAETVDEEARDNLAPPNRPSPSSPVRSTSSAFSPAIAAYGMEGTYHERPR